MHVRMSPCGMLSHPLRGTWWMSCRCSQESSLPQAPPAPSSGLGPVRPSSQEAPLPPSSGIFLSPEGSAFPDQWVGFWLL